MPGPHPAVAAVRSAIKAALGDVPLGARVLVGCSGGADSLALAAGTAFIATRSGLQAGAVIVDHRWFAGSAEVAARAAQACRELGLHPVDVVRLVDGQLLDRQLLEGPKGGPEAVARAGRYAAFEGALNRHGAVALLLGHTLDDQAETVLLGLARGSGARSLAGMAPRRGPYRRPLLGLSREATHQACAALGLQPWHDPANGDHTFARARLRGVLTELGTALGPALPAALAQSAQLLREDADALDGYARELLLRAPIEPAQVGSSIALSVPILAAEPDAVRRRALLFAAQAAGCRPGALGRRHALAIDALVIRWHGQGAVNLPGGVVARRDCDTLFLARPDRVPGRSPDQVLE